MFVEKFNLVTPIDVNPVDHFAADLSTSGGHQKIQVFSGTKAVKNYGISVQGSGTSVSGTLKGSLTSYDYKALYSVYGLEDSVDAHYWFVHYSKTTKHDELVKTFESSKTLTANYDLDFTIQGNDYGINSVFITFEVIRMVIDGVTKDFVVTNSDSAGANTADGSKYPGNFKAVPAGS